MARYFQDPHKKILEFPCGKGDSYGCGILVQTTNRTQVYCGPCQPRVRAIKSREWHRNNDASKRKKATV